MSDWAVNLISYDMSFVYHHCDHVYFMKLVFTVCFLIVVQGNEGPSGKPGPPGPPVSEMLNDAANGWDSKHVFFKVHPTDFSGTDFQLNMHH